MLFCGVALLEGAFAAEKIKINDPTEYANFLIVNRQFAQAERFIRDVLSKSLLSPSQREFLRYQLGLALGGQEKYATATDVFRAVLDDKPTVSRVRLALGRVLFLDGSDAAARRQFDLVLSDATAPELHASARRHLAAIRARNGWRFAARFRFTQNNNINNAPENNTVDIGGGLSFSDASAPVKKSGVGAAFGFSAGNRRQWRQGRRWLTNLAVGGAAFPGRLDASTALHLSTGPGFLFRDGALDVLGVAGRQFTDGNASSHYYGLNIGARRLFNQRWRGVFSGQYVRQNSVANDNADANVYYAQIGVDGGFVGVADGYARLSFTNSNAKNARYAYFSVARDIGLRRDFVWNRLTGGVSYSSSRLRFDGITPLLGVPEKRRTSVLRLSLLKRDWRLFGVAPEWSIIFNKQKSNVGLYSHDNRIIEMNLTKNF